MSNAKCKCYSGIVERSQISLYIDIFETAGGVVLNTSTWTDITHDTTRRNDDIFTYIGGDAELEFDQDGTYLVLGRISNYKISGTDTSQSSIRLMEDTGGGYTEVLGTRGSMYHKEVDEGCNTANIAIIYDATATYKIKLQSIIDTGTNIETYPNGSGLLVIRFQRDDSQTPNTKFFDGYNTVATTITGSYTDIPLNTERKKDASTFTHSAASAELQFDETATYMIYARCTTDITSGTTRSQTSMRLVVDTGGGYNEIVGTTGSMYNRNVTTGCDTAMVSTIYDATSGDKIKLQSILDSGSSTIATLANGSGIVAIKIQVGNVAEDDTEYFNGYNSVVTVLSGSFLDIPLNIEIKKDAAFNHTAAAASVELAENGTYLINYWITTDKTSGTTRSQSVGRCVIDSGAGFQEIQGSRLCFYNKEVNEGANTGHNSIEISANAGTNIKIQALISSGGNVQTKANSSGMVITKVQTNIVEEEVPVLVIFGSQFKMKYHHQNLQQIVQCFNKN